MNRKPYRFVPALLVLLATGLACAQDGGGRPPEGATQDEKRAFYQKRAAERAKADESASPHPAQTADKPEDPRPGTPSLPAAAHRHGAEAGRRAADQSAPARPDDSARAAGRSGGMGTGARSGVIWLSDSPPMRGDGTRPEGSRSGGMPGMEMGGMGGMGGGARAKRLWLRSGSDPQKSSFYREDGDNPSELLLVTPQGKAEGEALPAADEGRRNLSFEMPAQGFYRLYATTRKLQGETLNVSVAKAEIGNFTHDADDDERAKAVAGNRVLETAPIEIVRERQADEKPFFRLVSGDQQGFVVLQKGLPTPGARVRFISHQGWSKEALSDEQGRVSFQIIRDYFPPWNEFQRRFKASYLVIAEASAAESGKYRDEDYKNVRYQATLAGNYHPSPDDYRSYAWGLGVGLSIVLFCGVAVYLYRRRRIRPFREVRFDDAK